MTYKLSYGGAVQIVETGTGIPARYVGGVVTLLDEHSPFAIRFKAWVDAGNTPQPADQPTKDELNAPILAALVALDPKMLRALEEGDPVRIAERKAQREALRAQIVK